MRIRALHHVHLAVTDLDKTQRFAEDFGLKMVHATDAKIYMRTDGGDAYSYVAEQSDERSFIGLGLLVESEQDLKEAVRDHGGTEIVELEGPGGGKSTTLMSPEGLEFQLVHGIDNDDPKPPQPQLKLNAPGERTRFSEPQSSRPKGPASLFRLGHVGLYVKDFASNAEWLQDVLGMKLSDGMYADSADNSVVGFFRLDHGKEWVDHHTIFMGAMGLSGLHHMSFEVQDFEAQFRTHRYLQDQGWDPNWGVGRHPLGSHVFDVWFDPDRFRYETFSDTDLLNDEHETGFYAIKDQEMDVWSSDPPDRYFAP